MDKNEIIYCLKYIHAICLLPYVASDARRRRAPLLVVNKGTLVTYSWQNTLEPEITLAL